MLVPQVLESTDALLCNADLAIREVLARISGSPLVAQVVIDETRRVVGVITDGDVRRALLRGVDLAASVREAMNPKPLIGVLGQDQRNRELLQSTKSIIQFLPVMDAAGCLAQVLINISAAPKVVGLVMAGGLGTRLGERTRDMPKPLVPVGGKPMLEHMLQGMEDAKIENIYIAVHHLGEQIEEFLAQRQSKARLHVIREKDRLGTAGALALISKDETGTVLVANADVLTGVPLDAMIDFHIRNDFDASAAVSRHETTIPFGVIQRDTQDQFVGIEEKPTLVHFVAAGMYLIGADLRRLVTPGDKIDMPDLLRQGRSLGLRVGLFPVHEYWRDLGRPEDLAAAEIDSLRAANGLKQS